MSASKPRKYGVMNFEIVAVAVRSQSGSCSIHDLRRYIRDHRAEILAAYEAMGLSKRSSMKTFDNLWLNSDRYLASVISSGGVLPKKTSREDARRQERVDDAFSRRGRRSQLIA